MAQKLTVIIPCKNEEANIHGCIHSARKVADELLIADSGSTDRTLEIVRGMADTRIIEREYVHSGDFKNWAIPQATHAWVMILDADERIPDELAGEIRELLRGAPAQEGYWIHRIGFFMGHRVRFSGWQNDRVLRLFRRDAGVYRGENDHAEVVIHSRRIGHLRNSLLHYTCWNYHDYFRRFQRYSTYQAEQWYGQGRPANLFKLFCNFPLRFLQLYLLRLGFLDGLVGLQICALTALYSFSKQACLWQLRHGRSREMANRDVPDVVVAEDAACASSRAALRGDEAPVDRHGSATTTERGEGESLLPRPAATRLSAALLRSAEFRYAAEATSPPDAVAVLAYRTKVAESPVGPSPGEEVDRGEVLSAQVTHDSGPGHGPRTAPAAVGTQALDDKAR